VLQVFFCSVDAPISFSLISVFHFSIFGFIELYRERAFAAFFFAVNFMRSKLIINQRKQFFVQSYTPSVATRRGFPSALLLNFNIYSWSGFEKRNSYTFNTSQAHSLILCTEFSFGMCVCE
jgi:hypothetical protein